MGDCFPQVGGGGGCVALCGFLLSFSQFSRIWLYCFNPPPPPPPHTLGTSNRSLLEPLPSPSHLMPIGCRRTDPCKQSVSTSTRCPHSSVPPNLHLFSCRLSFRVVGRSAGGDRLVCFVCSHTLSHSPAHFDASMLLLW